MNEPNKHDYKYIEELWLQLQFDLRPFLLWSFQAGESPCDAAALESFSSGILRLTDESRTASLVAIFQLLSGEGALDEFNAAYPQQISRLTADEVQLHLTQLAQARFAAQQWMEQGDGEESIIAACDVIVEAANDYVAASMCPFTPEEEQLLEDLLGS